MKTANSASPAALVTGAGSGIGRACALQLARHYEVWVGYNSHPGRAEEVVTTIQDSGGQAHTLKINYADPQTISQARQQFCDYYTQQDMHPQLAILVNNAGVFGSGYHLLLELEEHEWDEVWQVNFAGSLTFFRQFADLLQNDAAVINMSSIVAHLGSISYKSQVHYVASKAATGSFFHALQQAPEWQHLRFINILPGLIDTGLLHDHLGPAYDSYVGAIPLGALASPVEIAHLVVFLAQHPIQIGEPGNILVDGGWAQKGWQLHR